MGHQHLSCKLAALNLGPQLPADAVFGPFSEGTTASEVAESLHERLAASLANLDPDDSIVEIDNPCNTELVNIDELRLVFGSDVRLKLNGENA